MDDGQFHDQPLGIWIANNWRPYASVKVKKSSRRRTYLDVLRKTRKDDIDEEMRKILNVTDIDTKMDGYLGLRNKAAKRVFQALTEKERQDLIKQAEKEKYEPNPVATQRQ